MDHYYVNNNAQKNGDHEVHKDTCPYFPLIHIKTDLGKHATCVTAVAKAKIYYLTADGCAVCCPLCHTS